MTDMSVVSGVKAIVGVVAVIMIVRIMTDIGSMTTLDRFKLRITCCFLLL